MSRVRPNARHGSQTAEDGPLRVLYVAVQDARYPRNSRVRSFLKRHAEAQITILTLSRRPGFARHAAELLAEGFRARRGSYDLVILAELSLVFAPVSWLLSKYHRARHVVDFFIGLYETQVEDRGSVLPRSPRALTLRLIDWFGMTRADLLLADTISRAEKWARAGTETLDLPVGAPEWARPAPRTASTASVRILYYGNYIPLHGVPQMLEALLQFSAHADFDLTMVGTGDHRAGAEKAAVAFRPGQVTFIDRVDEPDLADLVASHDVVMGIFGSSPKAETVIPNKVWQGLACGRVVVTRATEGVRELVPIAGRQLVLSESGEAEDIATAIAKAASLKDQVWPDTHLRLEKYVDERYARLEYWMKSRGV